MAVMVISQSHSFAYINTNNRHYIHNILSIFDRVLLAYVISELILKKSLKPEVRTYNITFIC